MANWFRRLWHLVNRPRFERELVDEMKEHRDQMFDASQFGDTHRLLEQSRDAWGWNWLDDAMQDLIVGTRALKRSPSFTVTAALILTFGIGLNLTLYQFVRVAMLRPPAIRSVSSWARFVDAEPEGTTTTVPYPLAEFVKANSNVLAAVLVESGASVGWGKDAREQVDCSFVSANWFEETGYGPLYGRLLTESIDTRSDIPSIVVSYTFWMNRLGGDPNVVGTTAYIDRKPVVIAGVAPKNFPGLDFSVPSIFIPISQREYFYPESAFLHSWNSSTVDMYGRFHDGMSAAAVREGLRATVQAAAREHPEIHADHWLEPRLATEAFMSDGQRADIFVVLSLIAALTIVVLIVAAANLGNLVMSRAAGRVRELGIRMALGARRSRIIRQLVIEAVPLAALGVAGSLLFVSIVTQTIAVVSDFPPYLDFRLEWQTIALAVAFGAVGLVVAGLLPAWKVAQQHLIQAIKDGGHHLSQSLDRALMRRVLVAAQVAGSCVLLIVAGMMVRSVQRVAGGDVGFAFEQTAVLSMPLGRYGITGEAARSYWYAVRERALANPAIDNAAIVTAPPLGGRIYETRYDATPGLHTLSQSVDPEYFATMKIPVTSGRVFRANEDGSVVVSRRLALEMYGTLDVLGQAFPKPGTSSSEVVKPRSPDATIVGVAADAHSIKVNATDVAELYRPLRLEDFSDVSLVARARTDANLAVAALRAAGSMDPRVIPEAHQMREDFDKVMQGPRVAGAVTSAIGLVTLTLACLGIFGVVSYGMALRTKEIGIRVALGASHARLLRALVGNVLTPVVAGMAIGTIIAAPVGRALATEPFYLQSVDPIAFVGALVILMLAATVAALWPAIRMLRGNPVEALRHS
jgi:macrolide transport system ATP-binding/permease protein